jgi:hypothetical protein
MSNSHNPRRMARADLTKVRQARAKRDESERALLLAMVAASDSGETFRDIAEVAGLSHQRVHELVKAERARRAERDE